MTDYSHGTAILSSTYFGPVQWYQKLNRYAVSILDRHEHFLKQTYRNRCVIATTQGTQVLSVPTERGEGGKSDMKDVRISDHGNWRHIHWNALLSAYGESPFFEYYVDDILPFFEKRWDYLFDFNLAITEKMCELLDIQPIVRISSRYVEIAAQEEFSASSAPAEAHCREEVWHDFRTAIRPKNPLEDCDFVAKRYYQVFEQKHGFQPNLSVLDLLFNQGNEAVLYL